jgi:hypothetical protein
MNPENQPNQQRPNFERIAYLTIPDWVLIAPENLPFVLESFKNSYLKEWENIEKGKISYPDNSLLEELLKEYHLEAFLPDFRFLGFSFIKWVNAENKHFGRKKVLKDFHFELIQALHYFSENKEVKIKIQSKVKTGGITIQNPDLINTIQQGIFDYFKENDLMLFVGKPYPEDIENWGEYIEQRYQEEKAHASQKGRKKGSYQIKSITFHLWKYLQDFTEIKAKVGAEYSREQTRFIFRFLEIYGLIENPDLIARKEDTISYYLKAFKQSRNKKPDSKDYFRELKYFPWISKK